MQQVCMRCYESRVEKMKQIAAYMCSHAQLNACQELARISSLSTGISQDVTSKKVTCAVLLKAEQSLLAGRHY